MTRKEAKELNRLLTKEDTCRANEHMDNVQHMSFGNCKFKTNKQTNKKRYCHIYIMPKLKIDNTKS